MERVDVDGMRIAYTGAGVGPLLVLLHGAPCDSRMWQWMLPDLSRDHTVLAWGAPGFGESSDIDDRWQAPQFADALAAFIASLGLERPHVVGHSFGTMVALSLFERHPAIPASLVLVVATRAGQVRCRQTRWHDGWRCSSVWPSWATRLTRSPTRACSLT
jgi:pimeloyl-ACP methyl ester carboxylesterase